MPMPSRFPAQWSTAEYVLNALDRRHQRRRQASLGPQKEQKGGLVPSLLRPARGFRTRRRRSGRPVREAAPVWRRRGVGHIPSPPVSRTLPSRQPVNIACRHRRGARPRRQRQCFVNINRAPAPPPRCKCPARHAPCSTLRYAADPARRCPIQGRMRRSRARAGSRFS